MLSVNRDRLNAVEARDVSTLISEIDTNLRGSNSNVHTQDAVGIACDEIQTSEGLLQVTNLREIINVDYYNLDCGLRNLQYRDYRYFGYTLNGMRHGYGKTEYYSGSYLIGNWKRDKLNGFGFLRLNNGDTFSGFFKNSKLNGFVEYVSTAGVVHHGEMVDFVFLKESPIIIFKNGTSIEVSLSIDYNTIDGILEGICLIKNKDGHKLYEGEYLNYTESGYGITFNKSAIYQGIKNNKKLNGICEIFYSDGTKFIGRLQDNRKDGVCCFFSKDKVLSIGQYSNNIKNGCFLSRKVQYDQKEIQIYECFMHGFQGVKIDRRCTILNYIELFYPEHSWLMNLNLDILHCFLLNMNPSM